jgi:MtaA/CmuA family methyltransferase
MTKQNLFEKLCNNEPLSSTLFSPILMHFAARHIGKNYGEFASDHKVLVEANIRAMHDFDMDMVSLISDPYRETSAFGAFIEFIPEGVPVCKTKVVKGPDDIRNLKIPDVYNNERTLDRIKGGELYTKILKGNVPVIGWIEGPMAEACDLTGVSEMLIMIMMDPENSDLLLDKCTEFAKLFAKAQIDAGCGIIGMGDAICSQIDIETYNRFVKDRHRDIISYIHKLGGRVKLHICGDITHLMPSIKEIGVDILDLDWQVDFERTRDIMGSETILCGNINPVTIQNLTAAEIYALSKELVESQKGKKFILSGGCEITVNTPNKNLLAMRNACR